MYKEADKLDIVIPNKLRLPYSVLPYKRNKNNDRI